MPLFFIVFIYLTSNIYYKPYKTLLFLFWKVNIVLSLPTHVPFHCILLFYYFIPSYNFCQGSCFFSQNLLIFLYCRCAPVKLSNILLILNSLYLAFNFEGYFHNWYDSRMAVLSFQLLKMTVHCPMVFIFCAAELVIKFIIATL